MPGPGTYDVKSFVEKIQSDSKSFILGKKENLELRKYCLFHKLFSFQFPI